MALIKIELSAPPIDGMDIKFQAPCDCAEATGLLVTYPEGSQEFTFRDCHSNNLANLDALFGDGAYVKVMLDVQRGHAYLQNADTNGYLEAKIDTKASFTQIWENAALHSSYATFVEQDIPLDWKKFDALLIDHAESAMWTALRSTHAIAGSTEGFVIGTGSSWRYVTFTNTGLHFGRGQLNGNNNDDYCIPYRIYGINFGGGGASSSTLPAAEGVSF